MLSGVLFMATAISRISGMGLGVSDICCQPCGALFPVRDAYDGGRVQCPCCGCLLIIGRCPPPGEHHAPQVLPRARFGEALAKVIGYTAIGVLTYKGLQALFDEDFGGGEYPRWFRDEVREEHVAGYGYRCRKCGERVRFDDLTVDHVVSLKNGGRTSRANADVICLSCNCQKGARNSLLDYIRGRSY